MKTWRGCLALLGLTGLLAGCEEARLEDLEQRLLEWRADATVPPGQGVMTWVPSELPAYRHARARSPFGIGPPQVPPSAGSPAEPNTTTVVLDELRLVGTLRVGGEAWALVKPPDGRVQLVRAGDSLGGGRVLVVEAARVRLMAGRGTDTAGEAGTREVQLTLDD
ncbi:pilus assembly protein PilP [Halomonas halmophila]|uniref:Pilus assembly protein PilP n=1 Tax=Halomonas halmophila TaxID=252 RepID=A0A4Y4F1N4_9GAMM|nr:pilus assembly protein PilP [Halomonas halmophila]GED21078.1 hypothetical protein HHA01_00550 [Halomonas halmophila]